jgi:2-polyprenyl-6-methoxyphenol hydroxylase-like FAD-dependent oxidoreductase
MDFDVVVTGAGPVGLMLAGELRLGGASVLVIERQTEWNAPLKAGSMGARSINAPSADAFDRRGLLYAVREKALWWFQPSTDLSRAPEHAGHFAGLPVRTALLDPADLDLRGNPLGGGVISVLDLETILAERASALGAQIRRGVELTGLRAGPDGVVVEAGGESITTSWLVGCDGGRSTVRALAGFAFPGTDAEFVGRQAMVEFADRWLRGLGDRRRAGPRRPPNRASDVARDGGLATGRCLRAARAGYLRNGRLAASPSRAFISTVATDDDPRREPTLTRSTRCLRSLSAGQRSGPG